MAGPIIPYSAGSEEGRKRKEADRPPSARTDSPKRSAAAKARASQEEARRAEEEEEESDESEEQEAQASGGDDDEEVAEEDSEEGIEKILTFKVLPVKEGAPQKEYCTCLFVASRSVSPYPVR